MSDQDSFLSDEDIVAAQGFEQNLEWFNAVNATRSALVRHAVLIEDDPVQGKIDLDKPLVKLGEDYMPSKRTHNYMTRYDHVFSTIRKDVRHVVVIGVQTDKSVRMWKDYFPNALITGIDIDPECKKFEEERINIEIGSQLDVGFLKDFIA